MTDLQQPLYEAVSRGQLPALKKLIKAGLGVNDTMVLGSKGFTLLQFAAMECKPEIFRYLLDAGADIHAAGTDRRSCFELVAKNAAAAEPIWDMALQAGADHGCINDKGRTLLHIACANRMPTMPAKLIALGLDVNARDQAGRTPLHDAACHQAQVIMTLLDAGAEIDAEDDLGRKPLHEAAGHQHDIGVHTLLALGASPRYVFVPKTRLDRALTLSPLANAVLVAASMGCPDVLVRSLQMHEQLDLRRLTAEIPSLHEDPRYACVHDVLRSAAAQRQARAAQQEAGCCATRNAMHARPGAAT